MAYRKIQSGELMKACRKRCACGEMCCRCSHSLSHRYICRTTARWKIHIADGRFDTKERRLVVGEWLDSCQQPDPGAVLAWIAAGKPDMAVLRREGILPRERRVI